MKTRNFLVSVGAVIALAIGVGAVNAQSYLFDGHSAACSERGGCSHNDQSIEYIPYYSDLSYRASRMPIRDEFVRDYYSQNQGPSSGSANRCADGGCSHGQNRAYAGQYYDSGSCSHGGGNCPYDRRNFNNPLPPNRSTGNDSYLGDERNTYSRSNENYRGQFNLPGSDRRPTPYSPNAADQTPSLRTTPALPPIDFPPPQQSPARDPATHDHAGHDHAGHNH